MSVILRFSRHGNKHRPFYDLVATDTRNARDGKFIEKIGYYDPASEPSLFKYKEDRIQHWYSLGAQLSPTVKKLLKKNNVAIERSKNTKK